MYHATWDSLNFESPLMQLEQEVLGRSNLVESRLIIAEPLCYHARVTLVLGWLAGLALLRRRFGTRSPSDSQSLRKVVRREVGNIRITGEADWPTFLVLALYAETVGTATEAETFLRTWIEGAI